MVWALHVVVINCGGHNNVHVRTIIILLFDRCKFDALCNLVKYFFFFSKCLHVQGTDPEKRQRYCHSPERASRSAKRVKVLKGMSYLYNLPLISRWIT